LVTNASLTSLVELLLQPEPPVAPDSAARTRKYVASLVRIGTSLKKRCLLVASRHCGRVSSRSTDPAGAPSCPPLSARSRAGAATQLASSDHRRRSASTECRWAPRKGSATRRSPAA